MKCVQSPSLEWENTGKRAWPAITIRLKLISTPVRAWFMAPVPSAPKVQISNRRESDGMGNKERQRENKREGEMSPSYLHFMFFSPSRAWREVKLFFQSSCPSAVCFWKGIWFAFVEFMVGTSLKLLSTVLHQMQQPLFFFSSFLFGKVVGQRHNSVILDKNKWWEHASL